MRISFYFNTRHQILALIAVTLAAGPAFAREQWQMHGANDPQPTGPIGAPAQQGISMPEVLGQIAQQPPQAQQAPQAPQEGLPTSLPANFWQNQMTNRVPAGTVLSGILDDNLSSKKSRSGDIFSIRLQDGFTINDSEVIPANSKIVGTVMSVCPAGFQRSGVPGTIQVSLQTLVMPNGRHVRFFGAIQQTPDLNRAQDPGKKFMQNQASNGGRMVSSFLGFITSRAGMAAFSPRYSQTTSGMEFVMVKGEVLPIRLNRTLIVPPQVVQANQAYAQQGSVSPGQGQTAGSAIAANAQGAHPNYAYMKGAGHMPGQQNAQVPGLIGPDPDMMPNFSAPAQARTMPEPF